MRTILPFIAIAFICLGIYFSQPIWERDQAKTGVENTLRNPQGASPDTFFSQLFTLGSTTQSDADAAWLKIILCGIGATIATGFYLKLR